MRIQLSKKICNACLRLLRVRYFCSSYNEPRLCYHMTCSNRFLPSQIGYHRISVLYYCMISMTDSDSIPLCAIQISQDCNCGLGIQNLFTCAIRSELASECTSCNTNSRFYGNRSFEIVTPEQVISKKKTPSQSLLHSFATQKFLSCAKLHHNQDL